MRKFLIFVLTLLLVAGCAIGGATAYRFNSDPDTPLGEGSSLTDTLYDWQMNFSNRVFLNGLYGVNLTEEQVSSLFSNGWLPEAGSVGAEVQITSPDGSTEAVRLVIVADAEEDGKVSKILTSAVDGVELQRAK